MSSQEARVEPRWTALVPVLVVLVAAGMLLVRGLQRDLNHDEHQFVAPGVLLSREGLLPYRDYPLFHLPNLVFAYAAADTVTGNPVLGAKLLNIFSSAGLVALVALLVWRHRRVPYRRRTVLLITAVALLLYDPVFLFTAGKTWNHEIPAFLICSALVLQALRFQSPHLGLAFLAGFLGGLGGGCRLTFGPVLIPMMIMAFAVPGTGRQRILHGLAWGGGAFCGLLPSLWLLSVAPEQFLFGNFEFPRLRLADVTNLRVQKTARWSAKVRYFFKDVVRPSWALFLIFGIAVLPIGVAWLRSFRAGLTSTYTAENSRVCGWKCAFQSLWRNKDPVAAFVCLAFPFALLGCFAPARYQYQHYFGIVALVAIGAAAILPYIYVSVSCSMLYVVCLFLLIGSSACAVYHDKLKDLYAYPSEIPSKWFAFDLPHQASELREHPIRGPVLTLAPILPLEAGLKIYPEFSTGPFAWKSAPLVDKTRRERLMIVSEAELNALLQKRPPGALLLGVEDADLEAPLLAWAQAHDWRAFNLSRKRVLWLPPAGS